MVDPHNILESMAVKQRHLELDRERNLDSIVRYEDFIARTKAQNESIEAKIAEYTAARAAIEANSGENA